MQRHIHKMIFTLALFALCAVGASRFVAKPVAGQETKALHGAAALDQLKRDGQYDSLQAAMEQARLNVSRETATPLGRWAWRAPNPSAGYDAYVTEAGVSIAVDKQSYVNLHLRSLGYGAALHGVAAGEVNGDKQSITIQRNNVREWFVNTPDGLEHGFTLNEPPSSVRQKDLPLRLAMQINEGWQALADEDGARVFLRNEAGQVIEYGKLVARDARGLNLMARLTVADEQVVIEVEDHDAEYPLTIDPLFTMQRRFIAFDGRSLDLFGYAVALDGDTAIIGAPGADLSNIGGEGAAYIFVRNGAEWAQQAKLTAADARNSDFFGISVALDGDTALIGATHAVPDDLFPSRGGAYIFVRNGSTWTQQQKLNPADGATGVRFGVAVALDGNTALVGAPEHKLPGTNVATGAAFVFTRSGTQWTQQMSLRANDAAAADRFGEAVALDADTALIGAPGDDVGTNADQGSAYLFTRNGMAWTQQPRLNTLPAAGDHFGNAVALAGHTAMIGAPLYGDDERGKVFTFRRNAVGWAQTDGTEAPQPVAGGHFGISVALSGNLAVIGESLGLSDTGADQRSAYVFETSSEHRLVRRLGIEISAANDRFGYAVAVEGNTVLAGAYRANATTTGAAYSYVLHDSRHSERQKLVAADGVANDQFGSAVALDGDTLAVGADRERGGQGAVYVFTRTGTAPNTAWAFQQKIFAADAATNDSFGYSVALSGDTLAVGTPNDDISHEDQGSAYIFNRSSGRWTFQTKLLAADSVGLENFGSAVALDGDTVIVGAPRGKRNPSRSPNEGAAYVFTRTGTNWMFQAKLFANDGEHDDFFGGAVALDSDTVAVGAPLDEIGTNLRQGSVYLFTRTGGLWSFRQKLLTEANPFAEFGRSVALAGVARDSDTLVVGAPFEKIGEHNYQGAAYVFRRNGDTWVRTQKLFDRDGASGDLFGFSVALSGDTLVAGTRPNDRIGAAFVYTQLGQFWYPQPKLTAGDGAASDYFGRSVAVSGDTIAVGASLDDSPTQRDQGSVYIFAGALCPPLSIAPASLPNGAIGSAYNQQLTGSGDSGVGDYLFSVAGGTLPPGLTLTPGTGVLAGTPTAAGTWRFTINTRFSLSLCAGSRTFTLTITSACAAITVNPATLPNGTAGTMYNQTLTASGGVAPYTFAVSTGSLPNGLSLAANGALTGTPIVAGTFNFTAQAGDANGCQGTRAYSVTITQGGGGTTGLQFYPLAHPIRLLETRAGQSGCFTPGAPIAAGT
ncbi:MAG TPA: putative Ig domain-containing protein, partial [Blastocatellia bacterium]|nr:putative Ig domain-containing protein [Blastocatellia bacterium]HNG34756.1 putative Ig domain-containing protein [Blastocatellia bacterium]